MKTKIYISGPMTGIPDLNKEAIMKAALFYKEKGLDVITPFDGINLARYLKGENIKNGYTESLSCDIMLLSGCDAIAMLPGWTQSYGCIAEFMFVKACLKSDPEKQYKIYTANSFNQISPDILFTVDCKELEKKFLES